VRYAFALSPALRREVPKPNMASLLKSKRVGWAIISACVTVLAFLSYFTGTRYLAAVRAVEHTLAVESAIHTTLGLLVDAETGHRGYLLTADDKFLEPLQWAQRDIDDRLARLDGLTRGDAEQVARLSTIRALIREKFDFIQEADGLRRSGNLELAVSLMRTGRGKATMDRIRAECRSMLDHEEQQLSVRKATAERAEKLGIAGVAIGAVLTVVFALFSFITVDRDVEELKRAAEELAQSEQHYRLLSEHSSDLVRLLALDGRVTYASPSVERILGYSVAEYLATPTMSLLHPSELELAKKMLADVKSGKLDGGLSTYRLRHKNGDYRWFEVRWGVIRDAQGNARELHTAGRDVTERREAEQRLNSYAKQLRSLSIRDELTGLYNRRGFIEAAGQLHEQALRSGKPAALIFADINGMKRINDELGHEAGDEALMDAADVLTASMHDADVVGRLGGDEFVAFAPDFTTARLEALRGRVRELADARVRDRARRYRLSMSVGAAFVDPASPSTLDELLERADVSMYEQKKTRQAAGGVSVPPPRRA